jgi:protein-L-isoaspartate(D-aspartate) O-methyltransferase
MGDDIAWRRAALVDELFANGSLTRPEVAAAFLDVPRHLFLPGMAVEDVYRDESIPTKYESGLAISSSSQPAIMAIMLEQLALAAGQRVLEIGAGTGYNAALLGHLVGPGGHVVTVDIDADIVAQAQAHLAAAGSTNVQVICADGGLGCPDAAPYDRIILTVGAWDIAPAWYDQLEAVGRLVLPLALGPGPQISVALVRSASGAEPRFVSQSVRDCGFMRLRGAFAGPEHSLAVGLEPGLTLTLIGELPVTADKFHDWLTSNSTDWASGVHASQREVWGSLSLWLGFNVPGLCSLQAEGIWASRDLVPCLFDIARRRPVCSTEGVVALDGLALLGRLADCDRTARRGEEPDNQPAELFIRSYGSGGRAVQQLLSVLAAWDSAGRPTNSSLRLRVYGANYAYAALPGEVVVPKRWTRLVIDWPGHRRARA